MMTLLVTVQCLLAQLPHIADDSVIDHSLPVCCSNNVHTIVYILYTYDNSRALYGQL